MKSSSGESRLQNKDAPVRCRFCKLKWLGAVGLVTAIASVVRWGHDSGYQKRAERVLDAVSQVELDSWGDSVPANVRDNDLRLAQLRASEWKSSLSPEEAGKPSGIELWQAISYYGSARGEEQLADDPAMEDRQDELLKQAFADRVTARRALAEAKRDLTAGN